MSLMSKVGAAKSSNTGEYAKPGTYYFMIENAKEDKSQKNAGYVVFETRILYVVDKSLWTGPVADVPKGKGGQNLMNLPGTEPKPLDQVSVLFSEATVGFEARMKKFVLVAMGDKTDKDWDEACANASKVRQITVSQAQELLMSTIVDQVQQPLRGCVLEAKAVETTTKAKEKIVGLRPIRRVWVDEIAKLGQEGRLTPDVVDYLGKDNRLQNQFQKEQQERAIKATAK